MAEHRGLLRTRRLTKTYATSAGDVHALRGVDFSADAGEFVIILGPSGSGNRLS